MIYSRRYEVDTVYIRDSIHNLAVSLMLQPSRTFDEDAFLALFATTDTPVDTVIDRHFDHLRERSFSLAALL